MDQHTLLKTRTLVNAQTVTTATATPYPTFPTGPTNGVVVYAGDFQGCRVGAARLTLSGLTTFTALDVTLESSEDGAAWRPLKAFAQLTGDGVAEISILDTDPKCLRFIRALVDFTGTPGSGVVTVLIHYDQVGPRGAYAPPGEPDYPS